MFPATSGKTALRIYFDPELFLSAHSLCQLLTPLKGLEPALYRKQTLWHESFQVTEASNCDFVVCPLCWRDHKDTETVRQAQHQAQKLGKPLLVFCETDYEGVFPVPDVLVFRAGLKRARRLVNEFAAPAFIAKLPVPVLKDPRPMRTAPMVGFCGQVDSAVSTRFRIQGLFQRAVYWEILSRPRLERALRGAGIRITRGEGKRVRYQALGVVKRSPHLQANFIIRDYFANGNHLVPDAQRTEHLKKSREEFCANVIDSDYTLCPRGGGNWSYRFFETLCLGRVPVFIDTDCVLPYESVIKWRDYCVWIDGNNIESLPQAVLDHYRSHNAGSFAALQDKCRNLWCEYLSAEGFFKNFHLHLPFFKHC